MDEVSVPTNEDYKSYIGTMVYRGLRIPVFDDDNGQTEYFFLDGHEYSCGTFNGFYPDTVKECVDLYHFKERGNFDRLKKSDFSIENDGPTNPVKSNIPFSDWVTEYYKD